MNHIEIDHGFFPQLLGMWLRAKHPDAEFSYILFGQQKCAFTKLECVKYHYQRESPESQSLAESSQKRFFSPEV